MRFKSLFRPALWKVGAITVLLLCSIVSVFQYLSLDYEEVIDQARLKLSDTFQSPLLKPQQEVAEDFFDNFFTIIQKYKPSSAKLERNYGKGCKASDEGVYSKKMFTESMLLDCLQINPEVKEDLMLKHRGFIEELPTEFPPDTYSGDGIVMTGGGKFTMLSYLAIKTMRDRNNMLPVEVFMPPGDKIEYDFCENLLPPLSAKCIYLTSIISQEQVANLTLAKYQFKSLALLASSFSNVLLLDADNFAIKTVDHIFSSDPFNTTGLVTWPDYWKRLTTPHYYDIAGLNVTEGRVRFGPDTLTDPSKFPDKSADAISFHDRGRTIPDGSTESGQLLVNKYKHCRTLLLSAYYNVYGPSHYYPMFNQGKAGEGDKDTFLAAANFFQLPFYQVKKIPGVTGFRRPDKSYKGVGMLQSDPVADYNLFTGINKNYQEGKNYDVGGLDHLVQYKDILFLHGHFPKLDPLSLVADKQIMRDGKHFRMYEDVKGFLDFDFEKKVFGDIKNVMCDKGNSKFLYLNKLTVKELNDLCKIMADRCAFLKETEIKF